MSKGQKEKKTPALGGEAPHTKGSPGLVRGSGPPNLGWLSHPNLFSPKRPKWKEMKPQKAKNKKWSPKMPKWRSKSQKWKEMKPQKSKIRGNEAPKGQKAKRKGNEAPRNQNERKWSPKSAKCKKMKPEKAKMKAQKAKMKGNEAKKASRIPPPKHDHRQDLERGV